MITDDEYSRLESLEGKLSSREGRCLAEFAATVACEHAIVELGSFKGKSACYLGVGSRDGFQAPVYAVDLWDLHDWEEYAASEVFATWRQQVSQLDVSQLVTPIRCDSAIAGRLFALDVGLLFIDGNHRFEAVQQDFFAWQSKVISGGVVAFHDYANPQHGEGVRRFVDQFVAPSQHWAEGEVIDSMYVTRRLTPQDVTETATDTPSPAAESWTFVANDELREQLRMRPPQYGLDLSLIVPRREQDGIYVDTHSPHYAPLQQKYQHAPQSPPLLDRVDIMCRYCPLGATCCFPRHSAEERDEILHSSDRASWCQTGAWGGEVDFVYPYIISEARGEELRYSLRSLEANYVGTPRVWLIGDKPDWYQGNHVPHQRLSPRSHLARLDRAAKMRLLLKQRSIANEFVWMMDDLYFLQPVTLQELRWRWKRADMDAARLATFKPKNAWQTEKLWTWQALKKAGRPLDDQSTHMPLVYEKNKLRRLLKKYRLAVNPLVDDTLYLNEYATYLPRDVSEVLYIEAGQPSAEKIRQRAKPALIMNHVDDAYTPAMQKVLAEWFPERSRWER